MVYSDSHPRPGMLRSLSLAALLTFSAISSAAATISVPFTLDLFNPTFNRTLAFSQGVAPSLSGVGTAVHYTTYSFTLISDSNMTISLLDIDGASILPAEADTFLILYKNSFNPVDPLTNAIVANDDAIGARSRIVTTTPLLASDSYTLVITSFANTPADLGAFPWSGTVVLTADAFGSGNSVPEPATLSLAAAALAFLAWKRR